jgi:hypothetical protein
LPPNKGSKTALENAGMANFFERRFRAETARGRLDCEAVEDLVTYRASLRNLSRAAGRHGAFRGPG